MLTPPEGIQVQYSDHTFFFDGDPMEPGYYWGRCEPNTMPEFIDGPYPSHTDAVLAAFGTKRTIRSTDPDYINYEEHVPFTYRCSVCKAEHMAFFDKADVEASKGSAGSHWTPPEPAEIIFTEAFVTSETLTPECRELLEAGEDAVLVHAAEQAFEKLHEETLPDVDADAIDYDDIDF